MYGFKSFARKTELQFEDGITAIIGPNGSGKSNIADAVRWVLGEQSAKALRGSKMEDIIFNGTEAKKALSFCEVSLTFDNADGELLTDYIEVCVSRRMYRSGESEYFINRQSCRRKDISELFRDTGVGTEGYSIIGQGRVEEILSNKSADRRNAFEEAAGVMKYRVRKEEAERKLESTRNNLERLNDILEELGKQVEPLREQSEAAREYLKFRDELREIEINVFLYQYDRLSEKLKALAENTAIYNGDIERLTALDAELARGCAGEEERERALNVSISDVQAKLLAMTTGVETQAGESKVFQEKLAGLIRERERAQAAIDENAAALDRLNGEILEKAKLLEEKRRAFTEDEEKLTAENAAFEQMGREIEESEESLEQRKSDMIAALNRLSDAKILISRFETMRGAMVQRIEAIEEGKKAIEEKCRRLGGEYETAAAVGAALKAERDGLENDKNDAISRLNETNQKLRETREALRGAEQQAEAGRSRLKVLEEMKRAHEGYYASVRNLLRDSERDVSLKRRMEGVVAELIRVPAKYETAIEMSLGAAMQNVVTNTEEDAKAVIEYLRSRDYGRATFLPISAMRPRLLEPRELEMCRVAGFIGVASELVGFDERYRGVMENLLGRTVVVDDLAAGIEINKKARSSFRIATLKGDIINPGGSMTGGSMQKREFSLVGREREIDELGKRNAALIGEQEKLAREAEELELLLGVANGELSKHTEALHARDVEIAAHNEKLDIIKKYVDAAADELMQAEAEISRIRDDIENIDGQFKNAERDRGEIEQGHTATQGDIRAAQERLYAMRQEYAKLSSKVSDMRVYVATNSKELSAHGTELERLKREAARAREAAETEKRTLESCRAQFDELTRDVGTIENTIAAGRREVDALTDRLHSMEEERARHLKALDELRERRETSALELAAVRDRSHQAELNMNRAEMELKSIQDKIWEDYELTYENAQPLRRQIAVTASHVRVDELKKAIKALGDVNVSAIEDYQSVKERFDSLSVQYGDLTAAEADLRKLIDELVTTMENEFRRQFTRIQENFSATFAELFGGGSAELVLSDKNDILNCNIDIIAQPPGKRLQLLSLLSGGERALTAIALLFAILKLKPTAFCILDEIETSLDEVNVSTVAQYVKHYSQGTQFILITHRKGSMEVCNTLYGVAMEEKGVSKVVSARFNAS
jgi:chromosome segregation protein